MTNAQRKKLGHGLRIARLRAKVRADEAGEAIGVTVDTVRRWERGDSPISAEALFGLAKLYGTTPDGVARDGGMEVA